MVPNPYTWYLGLPPRHRQSLITIGVFTSLSVFFIVLSVIESNSRKNTNNNSVYPKLITLLGSLVSAVGEEAQYALSFVLSPSPFSYEAYVSQQAATDAFYTESMGFIQSHSALHSWDTNYPLSKNGTIMTEQGMGQLSYARAQLRYGEIAFGPQYARKRYMEVMYQLIFLMSETSQMYNEKSEFTSFVKASTLVSVAYSILGAELHALQYSSLIESGASMDDIKTELKAVISHLIFYQTVVECLLRPVLNLKDTLTFNIKSTTYDLDDSITTFVNEATQYQIFPSDITIEEQNSFNAINTVMKELQKNIKPKPIDTGSFLNDYSCFITCSVISCVGLLCSVGEFVYFRVWDAKKSSSQLHNVALMHEVLVRVSEYVGEICTFSLAPKPPPKSMGDKKIGIVESQLQYLIGALKAVAPSLPPLLFPQRLKELAAEFSEVKDPATMVLTEPPRDNLRDEKMVLQDSSLPNPYLQPMATKTDLQEEICDVSLLYISLTPFHDLEGGDKKRFASEFFHRIVSIIEECVYQYNGVLHTVAFDKAVAVWNVADKGPNFCEQAATCGLMLSTRLASLRNQKRLVRERFPIHIGIVGGTVDVGVFGCEKRKIVGLFGPPMLRGMFAAQTNGFHNTTVACDDYIRNAIRRMYMCKPIELLPDGGCIHQVLHESSNDEPDLEMQLAAYCKAFELFEKKYYRGAVKAFRAYTKQYGYDSSVERIQALITRA